MRQLRALHRFVGHILRRASAPMAPVRGVVHEEPRVPVSVIAVPNNLTRPVGVGHQVGFMVDADTVDDPETVVL